MLCFVRSSNKGFLVREGQVKKWARLDTQNWSGYPNLLTMWSTSVVETIYTLWPPEEGPLGFSFMWGQNDQKPNMPMQPHTWYVAWSRDSKVQKGREDHAFFPFFLIQEGGRRRWRFRRSDKGWSIHSLMILTKSSAFSSSKWFARVEVTWSQLVPGGMSNAKPNNASTQAAWCLEIPLSDSLVRFSWDKRNSLDWDKRNIQPFPLSHGAIALSMVKGKLGNCGW